MGRGECGALLVSQGTCLLSLFPNNSQGHLNSLNEEHEWRVFSTLVHGMNNAFWACLQVQLAPYITGLLVSRLWVSRHVGHSEHFSWALQGYHFWYSTAFSALIWPLILALSILLLSDHDDTDESMRFFLSTFMAWGWDKSVIWIDPMGSQSRQFIHFFSFNPYLKNTLRGIESL